MPVAMEIWSLGVGGGVGQPMRPSGQSPSACLWILEPTHSGFSPLYPTWSWKEVTGCMPCGEVCGDAARPHGPEIGTLLGEAGRD